VENALWAQVDDYFGAQLGVNDPILDGILQASVQAGLPAKNVAPNQGKLLHLLVKLQRPVRVLEIGTLAGYSTVWMARALPPEGRITTLEVNQHHADVARANIANAGFADQVEVRVGPALELLPKVRADESKPFDLIFIDADKQNGAAYFNWAIELSRPGTLIIVDNVVRNGAVVDTASSDEMVVGSRRLAEAVSAETRVSATVVQTVGCKGYDGFLLAYVL
jgi:predicted O-methyltransferase YrrM